MERPRTRGLGTRPVDRRDAEILRILRADAWTSRAEVARRVAVTAPSVGYRLRALRAADWFLGATIRIDPARAAALGSESLALLRADRQDPESLSAFAAAAADVDGVFRIVRAHGEHDVVVRLLHRDARGSRRAAEDLTRIPGVASVRTVEIGDVLFERDPVDSILEDLLK